MYKVKCTGKNKNYGEKNEIRLVADTYLTTGLKNGWFTLIGYEGSLRPDTKYALERALESVKQQIDILKIKEKHIIKKLERFK